MINKRLMKLIIEESGLSKTRIYQLIEKKKKEYNYTITNEQSAALVATDFNIVISKILSGDELLDVRTLIRERVIIKKEKKSHKTNNKAKQTIIDINREFKVLDPLLPDSLINDAKQMAKIYPILFLFENSVRNLIKLILEKKYSAIWWNSRAPIKVREDVEKRLLMESKQRWHGKRGMHKIYYTNIGDLNRIISKNWPDFKEIFPSLDWIKIRIEEIEISRNVVAHNNSLSSDDVKRVKLYYNDWLRQVKGTKLV